MSKFFILVAIRERAVSNRIANLYVKQCPIEVDTMEYFNRLYYPLDVIDENVCNVKD